MKVKPFAGLVMILMFFMFLSACGGGGGNEESGPIFSISGTVTIDGNALQGVTITLGGASSATTTDASGNYTFTGLENWAYTVTPSLVGYVFNPSSITVLITIANSTGNNFTATANTSPTYSISGTVSGSGALLVTMTLTGDNNGSTITDNKGNYSFPNLPNGSYTVTPSLSGYTFTPANISLTVNNADITGQDFTAI
jgi:inhibitor of cysteine peptidase